MSGKITLITPPDFYENDNFSVLFLGLTEEQQEKTSEWLGQHSDFEDTNIYFYQGEHNVPWLLYSVNRADVKFLNLDSEHAIISLLGSYILSKNNVFYTTSNENLKSLMSHINNKFVPNVETFLEWMFSEQRK